MGLHVSVMPPAPPITDPNPPDGLAELLSREPAGLQRQLENGWNTQDCSVNMVVKDGGLSIWRKPRAQFSDVVRGRRGYSHGLHVWEIQWPTGQRGTHAMVGVATSQATLQAEGYTSLLGDNAESWGWNLSRKELCHNANGRPGEPYPVTRSCSAQVKLPDKVVVVLDMEDGRLGYMVNGEYLGTAFHGLKGKTLYPAVSAVWGHCEVSIRYIGHQKDDVSSAASQLEVTQESQDGHDDLPTLDQDTLHELLATIRTPSPVAGCGVSITGSPHDPQNITPQTPVRTSPSMDYDAADATFKKRAMEMQQELINEVQAGMETVAASIEGVSRSLSPMKANLEAIRCTYTPLTGLNQSLADIAGVMRQRHEQMPCQSGTNEVAKQLGDIRQILSSMERKQDAYFATMAAYHRDVVAVLDNLKTIVGAILPCVSAQGNGAAGNEVTTTGHDVRVPPPSTSTTQLDTQQGSHSSGEDDVWQTQFKRKTARH